MMNQTQFNKVIGWYCFMVLLTLSLGVLFPIAKAQDVTSQSTQDLVNALNTLDSSMVVVNSAVKDTKTKLFVYSKDQADTVTWWSNCAKDVSCWEWLKPQPK